jgi:hypothetical protein
MLQHRAKSIGIDNLVKNLVNKKKQSANSEIEKIMSTMNENDSTNGISKSIGSPSSPSSLSSASSTSSHSSSSSSSSNPHQQQALQAAVQALLHQNSSSPHRGLLTSTSDNNKSSNIQAMQQQQQLNQLLASIAAAQQQSSSNNSNPSALLNTLMQQQLENNNNSPKETKKSHKLNVKTKNQNNSRSLKGNSVSPPGTSSSCSDDQDIQSPSNSDEMQCNVKNEPHFNENNEETNTKKSSKTNIKSEENEYNGDLDRSTNSSASVHDLINSQGTDILHESRNHEDEDLDELDDYETSFNRDSKRHRNHSTSSPTRSTSSNPHSRSTSPSTTSYHDSPAAFPILNPLESATAMLGGLNCTPNGLSSFLDMDTSIDSSGKKRRGNQNDSNKKIKPVPNDKKDDAYWERRRKNNEAAKRSRDLRRQKEDDIAVKATILEQENLKLKAQVTILKAELSKLHFMLYNRN